MSCLFSKILVIKLFILIMYFLAHSSALRMNEIYNMEVLLFIDHLLSFIPVRLYH